MKVVPFNPPSPLHREEHFIETKEKKPLHQQAFQAWYGSLPYKIKRSGTGGLKVFCGLLIQLFGVGIFIYFVASTYTAKTSTPYLSLKNNVGNCERVTISVTKSQLLDVNGNWQTSTSFESTKALFLVTFQSYEATDVSWETDMENLYEIIDEEMTLLKSLSDLPLKMLHLVSWRASLDAIVAGTVQVWFNTDPAFIFALTNQRFDGTLGLSEDECYAEDGWKFSNGKYSLAINNIWDGTTRTLKKKEFEKECDSFDPSLLGFDWAYPTVDFSLNVDITTSLTIAALNANVLTESDLVSTIDSFYKFPNEPNGTIDYDNRTVKYDPKYPKMEPIYYDKTGQYPIQRIGESTLEPSFDGGFYIDRSSAQLALCPSECSNSASYCNTPDFIFSYKSSSKGDWKLEDLNQSQSFEFNVYTDQLFVLNEYKLDAGPIGCATTTKGSNGVLGHLELSSTSTSSSSTPTEADSISLFQSTLTETPPFKLQEGYFTCIPPQFDIVIEALGIAQGNTGLFVEFVLILILCGFALSPHPAHKKGISENEVDHLSYNIAEIIKKISNGDSSLDQFSDEHFELMDAITVMMRLSDEKKTRMALMKDNITTPIPRKRRTSSSPFVTSPFASAASVLSSSSVLFTSRTSPVNNNAPMKRSTTPSSFKPTLDIVEKQIEMEDYDVDKML